jgi:methyl-accepting chemotaxis protein
MANNMSDLTLEVLKDIRADIREMKGDIREMTGDIREMKGDISELRSEMHDGFETLASAIVTGFAETDRRIDTVIDIAGRHHADLDTRVTRIEEHLKLAR